MAPHVRFKTRWSIQNVTDFVTQLPFASCGICDFLLHHKICISERMRELQFVAKNKIAGGTLRGKPTIRNHRTSTMRRFSHSVRFIPVLDDIHHFWTNNRTVLCSLIRVHINQL